jgi:hypothetical protein
LVFASQAPKHVVTVSPDIQLRGGEVNGLRFSGVAPSVGHCFVFERLVRQLRVRNRASDRI